MVLERVFRDLDPRFTLSSQDTNFSRLIAPGLTTVDTDDLEPALYLAETIKEVAPLHWRATIKSGVNFSDGSPLRASDVAFTYTSILDPSTGSTSHQGFLDRFKKVEAISDYEVDFFLQKPIATLLSDLDFGIVSQAAATSEDGPRLVGTGAFALESFTPERLRLVRNEYFSALGSLPNVQYIEARTVRDGTARNLMLVAGSADFSQNGVRGDLVDHIEGRKRVQVLSRGSAVLSYIMFNNEDPLLSDVRVRRAIALAVDRKRIVQAKLGGRAVLATGLLAPFHWAYTARVQRYDFDQQRARELLDEAGYTDPDGAGGAPRFTISLKTAANQFRLSLARIIASQLQEIGIGVEVHSYESGTFLADLKAGNYQMATKQTGSIDGPDWYYAYFHSSRIPTREIPYLQNRWRYRNSRIDQLTQEGRSTMSRERRHEIYSEVQSILARDVPLIPLWHEDNVAVMNQSVKDYQLLPSGRFAGFVHIRKE